MIVNRARMLLEMRRYQHAEQEIRRALGQDPNNAEAHSILAVALLGQDKRSEALRAARHSVHLAPADSYTHYILALVGYESDNHPEAQRALEEAIRLNPLDPRYYTLLSEIFYDRKQWGDALEAADAGLKLFAEETGCLRMRALALMQLRRNDEARRVLDTALSIRPEDAGLHAAKGWLEFNQMHYQPAFSSFGEALRLNPNIELAQEGIVEAMKARNPVYRVMLNYYVWMSRMDSSTKWGILIGGYVIIQVGGRMLRDTPFFVPLLAVYLIFVFLSWTSHTLFDLLLRLDRFGRLALSKKRIIASNWVGLSLLIGVVLIVTSFLAGDVIRQPLIEAGLKMIVLILPIAAFFHAQSLRGRQYIGLFVLALFGLTVWGLLGAFEGDLSGRGRGLFILGLIAFTWLGNILVRIK